MSVKFIHIRRFNPDGLEPVGGMTIAYDLNLDTYVAAYAVAYCSWKDHYCKRIGRQVSKGRLGKSAEIIVLERDQTVTNQIVRAVVKSELSS